MDVNTQKQRISQIDGENRGEGRNEGAYVKSRWSPITLAMSCFLLVVRDRGKPGDAGGTGKKINEVRDAASRCC